MGFWLEGKRKALRFPKWLFAFCSLCFWFVCALRMRTPRFDFRINYKFHLKLEHYFFCNANKDHRKAYQIDPM